MGLNLEVIECRSRGDIKNPTKRWLCKKCSKRHSLMKKWRNKFLRHFDKYEVPPYKMRRGWEY